MDLRWLGDLLAKLLGRFNPLKGIQHWKIWSEMQKWYARFKEWRDWYKKQIQEPMARIRKTQQDLYNQFFRPVLKVVDDLRRITGIVGIFNQKLAAKLNADFFKVESYILLPFNKLSQRTNALSRIFGGFLTPLGYFDRFTQLNSIWRDAGLIRSILKNPFGQHVSFVAIPPGPTVQNYVDSANEYLDSNSGPYADAVDNLITQFQALRATE